MRNFLCRTHPFPKFGYSALGPTIFWWVFSKSGNISLRRAPPFPNTQIGKGECETTDQDKGRRGTTRGATKPDGSPKLGYSAMGSAVFWWIFSILSNILCFQHPPFPNTQMGNGEIRNHQPNKGAPRNAAERHGTLRNLAERLNLAIPHWGPPYSGGFSPN